MDTPKYILQINANATPSTQSILTTIENINMFGLQPMGPCILTVIYPPPSNNIACIRVWKKGPDDPEFTSQETVDYLIGVGVDMTQLYDAGVIGPIGSVTEDQQEDVPAFAPILSDAKPEEWRRLAEKFEQRPIRFESSPNLNITFTRNFAPSMINGVPIGGRTETHQLSDIASLMDMLNRYK